jgi:hypothetical protein
MWIEATVTTEGKYGKTSRVRVLVNRSEKSVLTSFPRAVVYSDTGVSLLGSSDIYTVNGDGTAYTPPTPSPTPPPPPTSIMARGDFAGGIADLKAPGSTIQSIGVNVNGNVTPTSYLWIKKGGVGLLSDYFDQSIQAALVNEALAGASYDPAPTAPAAPAAPATSGSSVAVAKFTPANITTVPGVTRSGTTPYTYTFANDIVIGGTLALKNSGTAPGVFPAGTTFVFQKVYMAAYNLTLTDNIKVSAKSLRVGGTLTINNVTTTQVTDSFTGPVYVAGTGASSVAGKVTISGPTSFYTAGALTLSNTSTTVGQLFALGNLSLSGNSPVTVTGSAYTGGLLSISGATSAITDQFGSVYVAGTGTGGSSVAGTVTLNATSWLYAAGALTLSNTATNIGVVTTLPYPGLLYAAGNLTLSGNTTAKARPFVGGNFTISGASSPVTNTLGPIYVVGDAVWSGKASVNSTRTYLDAKTSLPVTAPGPLWVRRLQASGTYNHVLGPTWVNGYSDTSNTVSFSSDTASTVMCPLLATTEQTTTSGKVDFGTRTKPMVYYMVCDNDGGYVNTCDWKSTGTFYGLMLLMEARIEFTGSNGTPPSVEGAVFCGVPSNNSYNNPNNNIPSGSDITLNNASVAYSQAVIDAVTNKSLVTLTTITQVIPGSWQQLSAN